MTNDPVTSRDTLPVNCWEFWLLGWNSSFIFLTAWTFNYLNLSGSYALRMSTNFLCCMTKLIDFILKGDQLYLMGLVYVFISNDFLI